MRYIFRIHQNLYKTLKREYKLDLSHLNVHENEPINEVLSKIDRMAAVIYRPDHFIILKKSTRTR